MIKYRPMYHCTYLQPKYMIMLPGLPLGESPFVSLVYLPRPYPWITETTAIVSPVKLVSIFIHYYSLVYLFVGFSAFNTSDVNVITVKFVRHLSRKSCASLLFTITEKVIRYVGVFVLGTGHCSENYSNNTEPTVEFTVTLPLHRYDSVTIASTVLLYVVSTVYYCVRASNSPSDYWFSDMWPAISQTFGTKIKKMQTDFKGTHVKESELWMSKRWRNNSKSSKQIWTKFKNLLRIFWHAVNQ